MSTYNMQVRQELKLSYLLSETYQGGKKNTEAQKYSQPGQKRKLILNYYYSKFKVTYAHNYAG